jgi:hypothetical protein
MSLTNEQPLFNTELQLPKPPHELRKLGKKVVHQFRYVEELDVLVRDIWKTDLADEKMPSSSLRVAQAHHKLLGTFGLRYVSYTQSVIPEGEITTAVMDRDGEVADFIAAHAVARHVEGIEVLLNDDEEESTRMNLERINLEIADPISTYIDWCKQVQPKYFLADIYNLTQYSLQLSSDIMFLHDVGPLMLTTNSFTDMLDRSADDVSRLRLGLMPNPET